MHIRQILCCKWHCLDGLNFKRSLTLRLFDSGSYNFETAWKVWLISPSLENALLLYCIAHLGCFASPAKESRVNTGWNLSEWFLQPEKCNYRPPGMRRTCGPPSCSKGHSLETSSALNSRALWRGTFQALNCQNTCRFDKSSNWFQL
jgi:hypothetical protein